MAFCYCRFVYQTILVLFLICACPPIDAASTTRTNIILVGATGNLAQKYLWRSLFNLYTKNRNEIENGHQLQFYGAGRNPVHEGEKLLHQILGNAIKQGQSELEDRTRQSFFNNCQYVQLKRQDDYASLCNSINQEMKQNSMTENGRIFYLSVPPFAYSSIASYISQYCKPDKNSKTWIRVVFEKPFGRDLQTAKDLTDELRRYFDEDQIYMVDHYLGKIGVDQILQFRLENARLYEPLWNKDYISRIEIIMKEQENCADRTEFYNSYGVIRDVMQNHLTEILALVCMELPAYQTAFNANDVRQLKADLIGKLKKLQPTHAIVGQYQDYISHLRQDFKDTTKESNVSTFAAVLLHVDNPRWNNVPIVMVAGKELTERTAYVRIVFKDGIYCLSNQLNCPATQIVFNIQGGPLATPAEVTSKALPQPILRPDWQIAHPKVDSGHSLGIDVSDYYVRSPKMNPDAYSVVVDAVFRGKQDLFVSTENLLLSWTLWTPLLHYTDKIPPKLYSKADSNINLRFLYHKGQIAFADNSTYTNCHNRGGNLYSKELNQPLSVKNQGFRNQTLFQGSSDAVVDALKNDILLSATTAIRDRNVFHIAFSGGSTPLPLFQKLASLGTAMPWSKCHIWMVDERCVPVTDTRSNFQSLYDNLLRYIDIPYYNIHPAVANQHAGFCDSDYYEREILSTINGSVLDYIVLGVGSDGHVASLFPGSQQGTKDTSYVAVVGKGYVDTDRITVTFPLLNKARAVSMLLLGERKQAIVNDINNGVIDIDRYPVTGIKVSGDRLKWFLDYDALPDLKSQH